MSLLQTGGTNDDSFSWIHLCKLTTPSPSFALLAAGSDMAVRTIDSVQPAVVACYLSHGPNNTVAR